MHKIIIVDDHKMLRDLMIDFLEKDFEIVAETSNSKNVLDLCEKYNPDLILMDVCTEDNQNGIYFGGLIKEKFPNIKIIIMTGVLDVNFINDAKENKIDSFVYKNISKETLINTINNTLDGYSMYPDTLSNKNVKKNILTSLTKKELELLTLYCKYLDRDKVCDAMGISNSTLKTHIASIYQKTGYDNLAKLAIYCVSNSFIAPNLDM